MTHMTAASVAAPVAAMRCNTVASSSGNKYSTPIGSVNPTLRSVNKRAFVWYTGILDWLGGRDWTRDL
jgi:hypothetical protein